MGAKAGMKARNGRPRLVLWRGPYGEMRTRGMVEAASFAGVPLQSMNSVLKRHFAPWHPNRVKVLEAYPELKSMKELPGFGQTVIIGGEEGGKK